MSEPKRLVWDIPLRLFHWLFALSIGASWLTAELGFEYMQIHFYLGYWTLGLLLFRIVWGFVGPKHARFSNFLKGPSVLLDYLKSMFTGSPIHTAGHNPAGGLMVIVMIILVAVQAGSGLFTSDDIVWSGPYYPAVSGETARTMAVIHQQNFDFVLAAIALHILAIIFYWLVKKQNLIVPMFTGHKPAVLVSEHDAISSSELVKAAIVIAICVAAIYGLVNFAPEPVDAFSF